MNVFLTRVFSKYELRYMRLGLMLEIGVGTSKYELRYVRLGLMLEIGAGKSS